MPAWLSPPPVRCTSGCTLVESELAPPVDVLSPPVSPWPQMWSERGSGASALDTWAGTPPQPSCRYTLTSLSRPCVCQAADIAQNVYLPENRGECTGGLGTRGPSIISLHSIQETIDTVCLCIHIYIHIRNRLYRAHLNK